MNDREKFIGRAGSRKQASLAAKFHESFFRGSGPANLPRSLVYGLRVAYLTYREFIRDLCWDRAASLTFTTIISLLPIAVLTLSVFGLFVEDQKLKTYVKVFVHGRLEAIFQDAPPAENGGPVPVPEPASPERPDPGPRVDAPPAENGGPVPEPEPAPPGRPDPGLALDAPPAENGGPVPEPEPVPPERSGGGVPGDLKTFVNAWVERYVSGAIFRADPINNVVAIVTLIIASLALLVSMERVFNRIWKVPGTRSYLQKFITFWMILTTSPLLVAATFLIDQYTKEGTVIDLYMKQFGILDFVYGSLVPLTISCLAFTFANLFLPKSRVKWIPAMAGGCLSGALWLVLKSNFYFYTQRAIGMQSFYGSLAIVPIFLVFLYMTWLVILAGGELSYTVQHYRRLVRAQFVHGRASRFSPPFLGLFVLDRILGAYSSGAPIPAIDAVADELDLETEELGPVVNCLVEQGVLAECADEPLRWTLMRDPASVPLDEVIARLLALEFREEDPEDRPPAAHDVFAGLHTAARGAYLGAFEGRRLSDLRRSPEGPFTADGREGGELYGPEDGPEGEENSQEEDPARDRAALSSHSDDEPMK